MKNDSKFERVLEGKDIVAIAFGAMIGWGWVINSGDWLTNAGFAGTVIAFLIGGGMVMFVGLVYAELTAAMPKCGGEHIFSYRAFGATGSYICTWAIILGYAACSAYEAAAFPTVIRYIMGDRFDMGLMYYVAGVPIYASNVITGVLLAAVITAVNIRGVKMAAVVQRILTAGIMLVGLLLIGASVVNGSTGNLTSNLFGDIHNNGNQTVLGGILTVSCMTPFLFIGFDVIPQAAEEIRIPFKKIGKIMLFSIGLALAFYLAVVFAISYIMPLGEIRRSMADGLVAADAMRLAFRTEAMGDVLIIGGMCGIVTSWNAFLLGGSRALYSMAEASMLPKAFSMLHQKYKTPVYAIALCGIICMIAPFFGKAVLIWLVDAASFGCSVAYFLVSISFLVLRKKEPEMKRPYKVKKGRLVGTIAVALSGFLMILYIIPIPFSSCTLIWQEWIVVGAWILIGILFYLYSKKKYEDFGTHVSED